jgi:acetoacetyl-CoA synthetase
VVECKGTSLVDVLWTPDLKQYRPRVLDFAGRFGATVGADLSDHFALHQASITHVGAFWSSLWDELGLIGDKGAVALDDSAVPSKGMAAAKFFPEARINYAENMLQVHGTETALISADERGVYARHSFDELRALVSRLQQAMVAAGVGQGDRVAAMMPNRAEAAAMMLAALSLGAVFSSCSPDFGVDGVLSRFGQIEPKLFFVCDGYLYAGKTIRVADKIEPIVAGLPGLTKTVIFDCIGEAPMLSHS